MANQTKDPLVIISWILIIAGLLILFGYVIGKSTGLINTPVWVSYIPHMAGGAALLGVALQGGKVLQKVSNVKEDVDKLNNKVSEMVEDVVAVKTKVEAHEKEINKMDDRIFKNLPKPPEQND